MQLNYRRQAWPLADRCPCDLEFLEYLRKHEIKNKVIFHFGTGDHHIVGRENLLFDNPNEIFGITASREEHESYTRLIIANPAIARYYKVLFADIYTLTPRIIPDFDLVTLFHLCEYYEDSQAAYAHLNDVTLVELFMSKLKPGGKILFYRGSSHFSKARVIIRAFADQRKLIKQDEYKTLVVYGLP